MFIYMDIRNFLKLLRCPLSSFISFLKGKIILLFLCSTIIQWYRYGLGRSKAFNFTKTKPILGMNSMNLRKK